MDVVKAGMGHGDLSMEAYSQVWEECYGQVNIVLHRKQSSEETMREPLVISPVSFSAGFVSADSEQVYPSQPGVEEGPYRKFREKAGSTSQLCSEFSCCTSIFTHCSVAGQINRSHMTAEARKAAKLEKKLKILLGGFQSRALGLLKQHNELWEQVPETSLA